jgi:antitoxin ParD1/3/4
MADLEGLICEAGYISPAPCGRVDHKDGVARSAPWPDRSWTGGALTATAAMGTLDVCRRRRVDVEITLPAELEQMVNDKVDSGEYGSASEVVHEAIRQMQEHDTMREQQIEDIRRKVADGLAQAERGEVYTFASGADVTEYIEAEGSKILAERASLPAGKNQGTEDDL